MQNLIASLLMVGATGYLLNRWIPLPAKQVMYRWLSVKIPALAPYLKAKDAGGCGSGCSSCNSCETNKSVKSDKSTGINSADNNKNSNGVKPVTIIRRQ